MTIKRITGLAHPHSSPDTLLHHWQLIMNEMFIILFAVVVDSDGRTFLISTWRTHLNETLTETQLFHIIVDSWLRPISNWFLRINRKSFNLALASVTANAYTVFGQTRMHEYDMNMSNPSLLLAGLGQCERSVDKSKNKRLKNQFLSCFTRMLSTSWLTRLNLASHKWPHIYIFCE